MQKRFVWWPDDRIKRFQKPKSCLTFIVIWDVETSVEVKTGHAANTEEGFEAMEDVVQSDRLFIHAAATSCTPSILVFSVRYTAAGGGERLSTGYLEARMLTSCNLSFERVQYYIFLLQLKAVFLNLVYFSGTSTFESTDSLSSTYQARMLTSCNLSFQRVTHM